MNKLISSPPWQPINIQLKLLLVLFRAMLKHSKPRALHKHKLINQLLQGQTDIQQLSQQLLAALQQQQTWVAAQLARQPIPPQAIPFALAPGHAFQNAPLNFETSVGLKIWEQRTKPLPTSYEVDSNGTVTFIEELKQRANANWISNQCTHHSCGSTRPSSSH